MASEFPLSPKLLKGALVVYASQKPGPPPSVIVFQYNPEQLSRTLANRAAPPDPSNVGSAREDTLRVLGPPEETINLSIVLNAADQLEQPEQNPEGRGQWSASGISGNRVAAVPPARRCCSIAIWPRPAAPRFVQPICRSRSWSPGKIPRRARTHHQFLHHRRGLRSVAESHPGQGRPGDSGPPHLHGAEGRHYRLRRLHRLSGTERSARPHG